MKEKTTFKVTPRGDGKKLFGKTRKAGEELSLTKSEALFDETRGLIAPASAPAKAKAKPTGELPPPAA